MDDAEKKRRILYAVMALPARVAIDLSLGVTESRAWFELSVFHQLKKRGLTLKRIADKLDVSPRKASILSKELKTNFLDPEYEYGLPRRIEYMIWGEPQSRQRIRQLLVAEHELAEIDAAIELLLEEKRIEVRTGATVEMLGLSKSEARLYQDDFMSRIDGLTHLIETITDVVRARFVSSDDDAFARNLTFRVAPEDRETLRLAYEEFYERLAALDEAASQAGDAIPINLSVLWAPKDQGE